MNIVKDFFDQYRAELDLYEATIKELKEIYGEGKLPAIQTLKEQKKELIERKQKQYESFKELRTQKREIDKIVRNRDSILEYGKGNPQTQDKPII